MKNFCFFGGSFFKKKQNKKMLTFGIVDGSNIWAKVYHLWKIEVLRASIEYRIDQLNNKDPKIAVNSTIQYFEDCSYKKCLLKVWSCFVDPPQNDGRVKFCVIERKPSFNGQYFQTLRISNIWFNENV